MSDVYLLHIQDPHGASDHSQKSIMPSFGTTFQSIHNVVDHGVLQAMWEELEGKIETP